MAVELPNRGLIFWPVGTGDSTTVRIDEIRHLQIDLRHMEKGKDDDESACAVIDELIAILPTLESKPFLSTFALTHPDLDHCQGFRELLKRVFISEIWMSPRTFQEYSNNEELCDDAKAFHHEAMRRAKATIVAGGDPGRGNRIRIIGYDYWLERPEFAGLPRYFLSIPGDFISIVDGEDISDRFFVFCHAPFKDDSYGDRNDCSLAFQISLRDGASVGQALLMGDLKYPIIRRIFDVSKREQLAWNVLLAPHHCSKGVFFWKGEGDDDEKYRPDLVQDMANAGLPTKYVVVSSRPIPSKDEPGANPPHAKAKREYLKMGPNEFLCTHEHIDKNSPKPISFEVTAEGLSYMGESVKSTSLGKAATAASATGAAPTSAIGFGRGTK